MGTGGAELCVYVGEDGGTKRRSEEPVRKEDWEDSELCEGE